MRLEGRDLARLRDIDIYATRALEYLEQAGTGAPSTLVQDAILRCFDVIGEAARATNPEVMAAFPAIPWPFMISMRNRVIHEYHRVDLPLVYATVRNDLPALIAQVRAILDQQGPTA
jgi:uncharacterized protein with HEPN domain